MGHGRSGGRRGHVRRWADYLTGIDALLDELRRSAPSAPVFLYGHSLGGVIALDYALERPGSLSGVIASAPAVRPGDPASPVKIAFAHLLSRIWPAFTMRLAIEPEHLSRDPEVGRAYLADALVHDRATARWGTEFLDATARVLAEAAQIDIDVLFLQGTADRVADPGGSRELAASIGDRRATLRQYEGGYHESHNDLECETVMTDIVGWLDARV